MTDNLTRLYYVVRFRLLRFQYDALVILLCRPTRGFESFELFRYKFRKHAVDLGIHSRWQYLLRADALWGSAAVAANHSGSFLGSVEQCLREFDAMFIRYDNLVRAVSFLRYNRIRTYYQDNDRGAFLGECLRAEGQIEI